MAKTRKLKPYVTRREMQAALMVVAKAADASIDQLRAEFEARTPKPPDVSVCHCVDCEAKRAESVPSPAEGEE